jgi:hypothetical protein
VCSSLLSAGLDKDMKLEVVVDTRGHCKQL